MGSDNVVTNLKRKSILSFSKYVLSQSDFAKNESFINAILFSWIEDGNFNERYASFKELDQLIDKSSLFDIVESIDLSKSFDLSQISTAISVYQGLIKDERYQELIKSSGYSVPDSFGKRENYLDGSLNKKVKFYRAFRFRLDETYQQLKEEGFKSGPTV